MEVAVGYSDGTLAFWDTESGQRRGQAVQAFESGEAPDTLAFSSNDKLLMAAATETMTVWDAATHARVNVVANPDGVGTPMIAAFSPDATLLAWSTFAFGEVSISDASARQQFGPPLRYPTGYQDTYVDGLAFSPDGRTLASAYWRWVSAQKAWVQSGIVLWTFDVGTWSKHACATANRNLTQEEWAQYLSPAPFTETCPLSDRSPAGVTINPRDDRVPVPGGSTRATPDVQPVNPPPSRLPDAARADNEVPVSPDPPATSTARVPVAARRPFTTVASSCAESGACDAECRNRVANACTRLGELHRTSREYTQAAAAYEKGCDGGDPRGCAELATAYLVGEGVAQNVEHSATLLQTACDGSIGDSCARLAIYLSGGFGIAKDDTRAAALNQRGCDLGDRGACASLGEQYSAGRGVTADPVRAASLLDSGCEGGVASACNSLGSMYTSGTGVTRDDARAALLYRRACETKGVFALGTAAGCRHLAASYEEGRGVDKNVTLAIEYYRRACRGSLLDRSKEACEDLKRLGAQ
jgi:TPR repeat protein